MLHDVYCSLNVVREVEMGRARGTYGGDDERVQGFGGKT